MKPKLEQLRQPAGNRSFLCYRVSVPSFELLWHYHPEYELTYILKGRGKRLVGDEYQAFEAGDFVLLPPLMPHTWISDQPDDGLSSAIVIQFPETFAAKLLEFPELKILEKLFAKAGRGLHFTVPKTAEILPLLQKMPEANDVTQLANLQQILQKLTLRKSSPIASISYKPLKGKENQQRISMVFKYVQQSFREEISLGKAAGLVHLSESAFCKFFKRASGKTFSDYVNEIRIGHACQLLLETDHSVRDIAIASGFESMTYFNRVFLRKKNIRPGEFRKTEKSL